jgi:hypothetical protein
MMRRFLFSVIVAIALVFATVPTAIADVGDPESGDLGLEGIVISRVVALKSGDVRVTGAIQCSEDIDWAAVNIYVGQDVGRFHTVTGYGGDEVACSGELGKASFSVIVEPEQGRFGPNKARVEAETWTEACWWDEESEDEFCAWDVAWAEPMLMKVWRSR